MTDTSDATEDSARNPARPPKLQPKLKRTKRPGPQTKYSLKLVTKMCEEIAAGSPLIQSCIKHHIQKSTFHHWRHRYPDLAQMYERAVELRIPAIVEDVLEIADDTAGDYVENSKGEAVFVRENVLRSKVKIETRQWLAKVLDPARYGERTEITHKNDWSKLTVEERERRAIAILDMATTIRSQRAELQRLRQDGPLPITYDPTDADDLEPAQPGSGIGREVETP